MKTCSVEGCQGDHYALRFCRSHYEKDLRTRNPTYAARQRRNSLKWSRTHVSQKAATDLKRLKGPLHKQKRREQSLRRAHGISQTEFDKRLRRQGGACAICRSTDPASRANQFHVDHDHGTAHIRGLLCFKCNRALGMVGDTLKGIRKFVRYLERTSR